MRIWVSAPRGWRVGEGRSVSVSGACLTAVSGRSSGARILVFDLSAETLGRTWFSSLRPGAKVNLERAMRLSDRLDGHLVTGHVDGRARIVGVEATRDGGRVIVFEVERGLERYLVDKGSIAVDGISLTVVKPRGRRFRVAVIPETLRKTTLGSARAGEMVNVEMDLIAKWIEKWAVRPGRRHRAPN